nr:hypothetical protein [Aeromonas sp. Marseille-Q5825]
MGRESRPLAWRQDHSAVRQLQPGVLRGSGSPEPVGALLPRGKAATFIG